MNRLFKKIPFPVKLLIIGLLPLIFLLVVSIQLHKQRSEKIEIIEATAQRMNRAALISELVDCLQSERRISFSYAITKQNNGTLGLLRNKTDEAITEIERREGKNLNGVQNYTFLNRLDVMRSLLDEGKLNASEVMEYYTNAISRVSALANFSTSNLPFLALYNQDVIGQRLLSEMATHLGNLRATIYFSLFTKEEPHQAAIKLKGENDIYHSYITEFSLRASPQVIATFNKFLQTNEMKVTNGFINRSISRGVVDTTFDADEWWVVSAKAVDDIKTLQRSVLEKVKTEVAEINRSEQQARNGSLVFLVAVIALVLFVISATIKSISDSLNEIKNAAGKIAMGATGIVLDVPSKDAVGLLATSIREMDENNQTLAVAADAIGRGQFDAAITPRSKEDILGNALVHMQQDLHEYSRENQRKIWIQTGLNQLNKALQGDKTLAGLTNEALAVLVQYLKADVGVFYISYERQGLYFSGGYALADKSKIPQNLNYGTSLIGQAAVNKTITSLSDGTEQDLHIRSATFDARPRHLLIIPLVQNNEVEGVVEIGALKPFGPDVTAFLEMASLNIAIALQSAKSKARLQELLEETQAQAEELQAQHSELENLNTELEAQAQRLQASEEELKVQQEELLQSNSELEERSRLLEERNQQIAERNLQIQQKAAELEQSTRYKSEFLANMSHELRTPLNSILLLSRLLSENNEKNLTTDQVEYAQVIQSSGNGLLSLIDEILDLSKIEAGKMELEYQQVELQDVQTEMKQLFAPIANNKNVALEVHIDQNVPKTIETDKLRLEQILRNLLSNALKFTSKGRVTLSVHNADDPALLSFAVKDTGIGIPKEKQQSVFEAFQQADGSTRRKFGGTGLGLSISRELAKLLGGRIELQSKPGEGSEFTVFIPKQKIQEQKNKPLSDQGPDNDIAPIDIEAAPVNENSYLSAEIPEAVPDDRNLITANDKSLLIVEDDTAFAKALLDYTRGKGYKGIVTVRGDEAVNLAKKYHPAGILLDIQLPIKSGWDVMEELKSDSSIRHIPVHIMSSHTVRKESLQKGAIDFINKPVAFEKMQDIFNKIEQVIQKENRKVLIIEENPKHAKALAYFLDSFDVSTEISNTVSGGVNALKNDEVDCVILDMGIPDMSTYQTLEKIKELPGMEQLPIIVFTGKSLSKAEEERLRQYTDSIVVKTAHSYKRILDEVSLFLHLVEENKQNGDRKSNLKLGTMNEVLKGKTVLVTDDDVRNIFSLTRALEASQMNVLSATDGKEALKVLEQHPEVDVVLMDIMMPEMDGYETMKQVRKKPQYKNLPVIAVTAKAMIGDREKCIRAGASDYISKPVDVDQLLSLLRVWLYERTF
ncbi:MAG TPA: response regulator [Flavipsychrobacter sp.]|nr:response regulator [Flavipsychrobacter sp.]